MKYNPYELLKIIMLWSNGSICENCRYKNDKDKCGIENCKRTMENVLINEKGENNDRQYKRL